MKKYFLDSPQILVVSLLVSFLVGFIVTLQWKSGIPKQSLYPLDQLESQRELLKIFVEDQQELEKEVSELRHEIETTQEKFSKITKNQKPGFSEVKDDGVEVFLGDSPLVNRNRPETQEEGFVQASDLRDVLNLLFSSGAEAIAVNNRRILPLHSVNVIGNTFLIEDSYTFPPFTITVIGPVDVMTARLEDETFLSDLHRRSREKRLRLGYQIRKNLTIPAYKGSLRTEFLTTR